VAAKATNCVPIPDAMPFDEASAFILQTVRKLPFIVTRGEAGQDEDDKISVTPDGQFCG
jgi:hypothetical protein